MKLSKKGADFIKKEEGFRLQAYPDGVGVWTIGYGHTTNVTPDMVITEQQADQFFDKDIKHFEKGVNRYVIDKGIKLSQNQFDALVSLVFNVGLGSIFTKDYGNSFGKGSTLYYELRSGNYKQAAARFTDFKKADGKVLQGLLNRRKREQSVFLTLDTNDVYLDVKKKLVQCPCCSSLLEYFLELKDFSK